MNRLPMAAPTATPMGLRTPMALRPIDTLIPVRPLIRVAGIPSTKWNVETMGPRLTVFSNGLGQDSAALWNLYRNDRDFRKKYAPNDVIFVTAATGDEHSATPAMADYLGDSMMTDQYCEHMKIVCAEEGIPFFHLTNDLGLHSEKWMTLNVQYDAHKTVGSKAFPKTCTSNLKITPIYKFLTWYIAKRYGYCVTDKNGTLQGDGVIDFAAENGPVTMIIGIAKGEEGRRSDPKSTHVVKSGVEAGKTVFDQPRWRREGFTNQYPLVDLGLNRAACQEYIKSVGAVLPFPSNCRRCPWMSLQELLWLYTFDEPTFWDWSRQEGNKLDANAGKCADSGIENKCVWGGTNTLEEMLIEAIQLYGHWSPRQLMDYKLSHGSCALNKF